MQPTLRRTIAAQPIYKNLPPTPEQRSREILFYLLSCYLPAHASAIVPIYTTDRVAKTSSALIIIRDNICRIAVTQLHQ
jgi:hypothetical protein